MKLVIVTSYEEMSRLAADRVTQCIADNPHAVLGLATGSTPLGMYAQIVRDYQQGQMDFSSVTTFNLDEYRGLPADHPQSYRYFMDQHLFNFVNIQPDHIHLPDGMALDADQTCQEYEQAIQQAGGIDLQILGLGLNGHIGFNEPDDHFPVAVHPVTLAESTIQANSRLFDSIDDVPREAYTMGIGTIMKARHIVVLANGTNKAEIVRRMCFGPVVPHVPASVLQLHPHVTVIVDAEAGSQCIDLVGDANER